jgi:hypothetical protein
MKIVRDVSADDEDVESSVAHPAQKAGESLIKRVIGNISSRYFKVQRMVEVAT